PPARSAASRPCVAATRPRATGCRPRAGTVSCRACSADRLTGMLGALGRLFRPDPIPTSTWLAVQARVPWVAALDPDRQSRLALLAAQFLHGKAITPLGGLELDDIDRTCLAALCCLPLLEFGAGGLAGWSQLLVYPEAFRVNRTHMDAAGVLHEWDDELIGESWEAGPLVLSWADVRGALSDLRARD